MRVKDEQAWSNQMIELNADEHTRLFKQILLFWADTAETMIDESATGIDRIFTSKSTVHHHLSKALEVTEQTFEYLAVEWIAQMLLVLTEYWIHGDALAESLTYIEARLVSQARAMKILELQESARLPIEE